MEMKPQLAAVVFLSLLAGCNNLSDADYQALRCEIWREQDSDRRSAPYSVVLNKTISAGREASGQVASIMYALLKMSRNGLRN